MNILTIDPGLSVKPGGTGLALFKNNDINPTETKIIFPIGKTWEERLFYVQDEIENKLKEIGYSRNLKVYIELPTFFTSVKGMTCATGKDNADSDLVKLAALAGSIYCIAKTHVYGQDSGVYFIRIQEWKGTLSKRAVESRIKRRLGLKQLPFSSHALDAVGIGLYVLGHFSANSEIK